MICVFCEDGAAAGPGTDDVEGETDAGAAVGVAYFFVGVVEPFSWGPGG